MVPLCSMLLALLAFPRLAVVHALSLSQEQLRMHEFAFAPAFDAGHRFYFVGAYALQSKGILRIVTDQANQIVLSRRDDGKSNFIDIDEWTGKNLWVSFGTEETVMVTQRFRCSNHLVLLDCVLPPKQAALLQSGIGPGYVSLVAEDAAQPGQWEPLVKAKIHSHQCKLTPGSAALCSSALRSGLQPYVLEWVNWHLMLGVDHIIIYLADMSPSIPELLRPYVESGTVELRFWQLPELWPHVLMSQQIALINDCLYRATDRFDWLMSVDLDEYLFPGRHSSLKSILGKQSKEDDVGSLLIKTWDYSPKIYPWEGGAGSSAAWGDRKAASNGTTLGDDLELLTVKHFDRRAPAPHGFEARTKAIWRPARVESAETHFITHGGRTVNVEESTLHWKHFYVLYTNRPLSDGLAHEEHDPSAYERFGREFTARWPFGFVPQA